MIDVKGGKEIAYDDLHIWVIPSLSTISFEQQTFVRSDACQYCLSHSEQQRARRFSHPDSRYDYIYSRLAMRSILAGYVNCNATELALDTTALGKPALKQGLYPVDLRFNLSHTQGLALLAVSNGQEVGIDIEKLGRQRKIMALALRYFAQSTTSELATLSTERQEEAFLHLWTQFEAFKKAKGEGLRGGDKDLPLPLYAPVDEQFYYLLPEGYAQQNWQAAMLNLKGHKEYISCVVTENRSRIRHRQFRPVLVFGA